MMDPRTVIQAFKAQKKAPYECPLCKKVYKSFSGAEYHILRARHADDGSWIPSTPARPIPRPPKYKKKQRKSASSAATPSARPGSPSSPPGLQETMSFADAQGLVQFDLQSGVERWQIEDDVDIETVGEATGDSCEVSKVTEEAIIQSDKEEKEMEQVEGSGEANSSTVEGERDEQTVSDRIEHQTESADSVSEVKASDTNEAEGEQQPTIDGGSQHEQSEVVEGDAKAASPSFDVDGDKTVEKSDEVEDETSRLTIDESALSTAPSPRPTTSDDVGTVSGNQKAQTSARKPGQTPKARKTPKNSRKAQAPGLPQATFRTLDTLAEPESVELEPDEFRKFEITPISQLEGTVEYDMDEEDCVWLKMMNDQRESEGTAAVSDEHFELLMDRLEKESCFESHREGDPPETNINENAVCCICQDGECQNSNAILFCDMCNMAVHQECYGVPYIPEGQWLCRRCLHSPSRPVDCCLCPNKGGAFKQTDDGRWAHVVCALWIPEVGFANPVFLEPIDGISEIPAARWRLNCCICKHCLGAAIQCVRPNCYTAFHPTCAQQAGLYLKVEPATDSRTGEASVRKVALCDVHTQLDSGLPSIITDTDNVGDEIDGTSSPSRRRSNAVLHDRIRQQAQDAFKKSRRLLEERGKQPTPVVSVPRVSVYRLGKIASQVTLSKKLDFVTKLQAYWMLKRQSRSGVPLLRRLQATQQLHRSATEEEEEVAELKEYIKQWQCLQQDLEHAQGLMELIQKREKLKLEMLKFQQQVTSLTLDPVTAVLRQTVNMLKARDTGKVFTKPVCTDEVRDYLDVIDTPMDLSTMEVKVNQHEYANMDEFVSDFDIMVNNAMIYNGKESYYFRAAMKMREVGGIVIRAIKRSLVQTGIDETTGMHTDKIPCIAEEYVEESIPPTSARPDLPVAGQLKDLQKKLTAAHLIRHTGARLQRVKQLKKEIALLRRKTGTRLLQSPVKSPMKLEQLTERVSPASPLAQSRRSQRGPAPQPGSEEEKESKRMHLNIIDVGVRRWAREHRAARKHQLTSETDDSRDENYSPDMMDVDEESGVEDQADVNRILHGDRDSTNVPSTENVFDDDDEAPAACKQERIHKRRWKRSGHNIDDGSEKWGGCGEAGIVANGPTGQSRYEAGYMGRESRTTNDTEHLGSDSTTDLCRRDDKKVEEVPDFRQITHRNVKSRQSRQSSEDTVEGKETKVPCLEKRKRGRPPKQKSSVRSGSETREKRPCLEEQVDTSKKVSSGRRIANGISETERGDGMMPNGVRLSVSPDVDRSDRDSSQTPNPLTPRSTDSNPHRTGSTSSSSDSKDSVISPLTLVWAKCRGYPSYPALVVDPDIPRRGIRQNGVPIPVPPDEVLELKHQECDYLVLFFDTRRTWQWLPRLKLNFLGTDDTIDQTKLQEGKKTSWKRSVQEAFKRAIAHQKKVDGQLPVSSDGDSTESSDAE